MIYRSSGFSRGYLVGKSLVRLRMNNDMHLSIKKLALFNPLTLFSLTSFDNLIELSLVSTTEFKRPNRITFFLKNLETFDAKIISPNVCIVLETPNLRVVWLGFGLLLDQFKFVYPQYMEYVARGLGRS